MELHKRHGEKVAPVTLSIDFSGNEDETPLEHKISVDAQLEKLGAGFRQADNVLSSVPAETMKEKLSVISPPAVLVYGKNGKLVKKFDAGAMQFTYEDDVAPLVSELVGQ